MAFFDKMESLGQFWNTITNRSGVWRGKDDERYILKKEPDIVDGFEIPDKLRELLIVKDSDNYSKLNKEDKSEFVFQLFQLLVIGGRLCQYEDRLKPYMKITKALYKDCVR